MKKHFLWSVGLFLFYTLPAQKPEGAFFIKAAQYGEEPRTPEQAATEKVIKVFKDGYWMAAHYKMPERTFIGSGGGTFKAKDGKYIETLSFWSWDQSAVNSTYTFDYRLTPASYSQEGRIHSDKYPNYLVREEFEKIKPEVPLQHSGLEGVWEITEGSWASGRFGEGEYAGMTGIKIYAYPALVFGYYKPATKEFVAAGGGTYQFDGKTLTENLDFFSLNDTPVPATFVYSVETKGKAIYHQKSADGVTKESWKKITNQ